MRSKRASAAGSAGSARPAATSFAHFTIAIERAGARSQLASSAGAMPAKVVWQGRSVSGRYSAPLPFQALVRPHLRMIRFWICAARDDSMSCSVIAQASASHANGRRFARSHGRRRIAGPMNGSRLNSL